MRLEVVSVPVLDTGLGREAGYASDRALAKVGRRNDRRLGRLLKIDVVSDLRAAEDRAFLLGEPQRPPAT